MRQVKKHKIQVKKRVILFYTLLLLPFFEPGCIESFVELNIRAGLFTTIGSLFALCRYLATLVGLLLFIKKFAAGKRTVSNLFKIVLAITVLAMFSNLINGASTAAVVSVVYEIGFICICEVLVSKGYKTFIYVQLVLLGVLCLLGAASIVLFPHGFNHAPYVEFAIYFLGSKNAAINYYLAFLLAYWGIQYERDGKLSKAGLLLLGVFLLTAFITSSGSTIVCLLVITAYFIIRIVSLDGFYVRPWIPFAIIVFFIIVIYMGIQFNIISTVISLLGKSQNFSGRTVLWNQAIQYFKQSPLFGVGINTDYFNTSGVIQHSAHSQYLDRLAKYGLISFIFFLLLIFRTECDLCKAKNKTIASVFGVVYAVYILKMGFDTYNFRLFIMVTYLIEELMVTIEGRRLYYKKTRHLKDIETQ